MSSQNPFATFPGRQAPQSAGFPQGAAFQGPTDQQVAAWGFSVEIPAGGLPPLSGARAVERDVWEPVTCSVQMPGLAATSAAVITLRVGIRRQSTSASRDIVVPPWGIAVHCGAGFDTLDILAPAPPGGVPILVYGGMGMGRTFRESISGPDILVPPVTVAIATPPAFARTMTITVIAGALAATATVPALAVGQSIALGAAVRTMLGGVAGATVSVVWEVIAP